MTKRPRISRTEQPPSDAETDNIIRSYKNLCDIIDALPADTPPVERIRLLKNRDFVQIELFNKGISLGSII